MTSIQLVFDSFLSKQLDDEWSNMEPYLMNEDLLAIMNSALPHFKFPRKSLEHDNASFFSDLDNSEIQIISTYMKIEWLNRSILTWNNIRPQYEERDFSPANLLDRLIKLLEHEEATARRLEGIYYRSTNGKPYSFRKLAGG